MASYAGSRVKDTAMAFNELGHQTGLSSTLRFDDVTLVVATAETAPAVLRPCRAVVVAVETDAEDGQPVSGGSGGGGGGGGKLDFYDDDGVVRFLPTIAHIPDVYAFLHMALNCQSVADAINSILDKLAAAARENPLRNRNVVIQQAADLRQAYLQTAAGDVWGTGSASLPRTPPRYFTFVRSQKTGGVYLIDGQDLSEIDPAWPSVLRERKCMDDSTVLTATVRSTIHEICQKHAKSRPYSITALVSQD
ncbi:Peptidase C12, ubiquitin carboxyl-terminal hydrolase 1 [Niveomyces insectorum RCEF 264]|uniref:Peptidase C12, ubiquitin carboxyl-terminal hydrolase 1 n=1 Tax=Niveomyces insectorum RCEF 264 TaxID=1081102 RepID=A0A167P2Y0_9HYPO|nr:Peptidase C12, ubiquitin carboxyl-terminal hydrolase 1 [Niveomyces insectorum RCEF 264]